jgi:rfaE bifunctional protein nucleotidyltransferase chain/domain
MLKPPQNKIKLGNKLVKWCEQQKKDNKKIVFTNGCFDILHRGHTEYLFKARLNGDVLLVMLNNDESVKKLKGPTRPINDEYSRAFVLSSLYFIDAVSIFESPTCVESILTVKPDIYIKGADYTLDTINKEEKSALEKVGAEICFIDFTEGFSTSNTLEALESKGKQK